MVSFVAAADPVTGGSVLVVMIDVVGHEYFELVAVPDDGAVEELAAD